MIAQGLLLAIIGMIIVFVFLTLIILIIQLMTLTLKYYENAIEKKRYKSKNILRNIPDDKKVIAAIAAVTYKMAKNKKGNQSNS